MVLRFIHSIACIGQIIFHYMEIPQHTFINQLIRHLSICFFLLWMNLLWAFVNEFLFVYMFSFLLAVYIRMEFLGHMVIILMFWGTFGLFFFLLPLFAWLGIKSRTLHIQGMHSPTFRWFSKFLHHVIHSLYWEYQLFVYSWLFFVFQI